MLRTILSVLSRSGKHARLIIFAYHRVFKEEDPLNPNDPDITDFEKQISLISHFCNVIPLSEAAILLEEESLPPRAACLTFDDGYRDNLDLAAPILEKYELTATVFLAVNAIRDGIMWNDIIIEAVRSASTLSQLSHSDLKFSVTPGQTKHSAIVRLISELKYVNSDQRWRIVNELYRSITDSPLPRLMMTEGMIREISHRNFELGAHTVSHPILALLDNEHSRKEILESKRWLEDEFGIVSRLFAYPNGKLKFDYDQRHPAILRDLGFNAAVTTDWGCATEKDSLFELPRISPGEVGYWGFFSRLVKTYAQSYLSTS